MSLMQVIKFDGPAHVLVWKYPKEDISLGSQLVVGPSQEAVFVERGEICDVFSSGTYTLETDNLPLLGKMVNLPFGGRSPFPAEVFFVNRLNILDIKWGTPVPIQIKDPVYQVIIPLRAFGQYGVEVEDSALFLRRLVGTTHTYTTDDLVPYFRGLVGSRITDELASCLPESGMSFLEANAHISELSQRIARQVEPVFSGYGVKLVNFCINSINAPENDPSVRQLRAVLNKKYEMEALQYNYQQGRTYDILEQSAVHSGGDGGAAGVYVGAALGGVMSDLVRQSMQPKGTPEADTEPPHFCRHCGGRLREDAVFCPQCGRRVAEAPGPRCPACGAACRDEDQFCARCGQRLLQGGQDAGKR